MKKAKKKKAAVKKKTFRQAQGKKKAVKQTKKNDSGKKAGKRTHDSGLSGKMIKENSRHAALEFMNDSIFKNILKVTDELHHINDIDILLDKLLFEVRKLTNAEAGTIFLREQNVLKMSYTQNDVLFSAQPSNRYKYLNHEIVIDEKSMAGYVAVNGNILDVKDAYKISSKAKYSFNKSFDKASDYRTRAVLTIPLKTYANRVIGVMQIINPRDLRGKPVSFTEQDKIYVTYFAKDAAIAIERAKLTRSMILRMLRMVELRDPKETGAHVNRMGAYAVEIYDAWARQRGLPDELIRRFKDKLRIAAMMHDAGKVAIPDQILKKPAKLTDEEFDIMKMHTVHGYRLFEEKDSEIDAMAAEIALTHHERWDGGGYPGKAKDFIYADDLSLYPRRKGVEIPITGRITAVADVYDALISKRVYKDAWDEDRVLDYIKRNGGTQFDPEVTEMFFKVYDVITAIRDKFV